MAEKTFGKIVAIIGPVLDVEFPAGQLPEIYNALRIEVPVKDGAPTVIIAEVEQHLGENRVRSVAMKPTDGLQRGMKVEDLAFELMPDNDRAYWTRRLSVTHEAVAV